MIRRLVFVLVCLGLALQGTAVRGTASVPCPTEEAMQVMLDAGELDAAALPDCCNDGQTIAATGQPCKTGHDGTTSPPLGLVSLPRTAGTATSSAAPRAAAAAMRPAPVSLPWRPPALR